MQPRISFHPQEELGLAVAVLGQILEGNKRERCPYFRQCTYPFNDGDSSFPNPESRVKMVCEGYHGACPLNKK